MHIAKFWSIKMQNQENKIELLFELSKEDLYLSIGEQLQSTSIMPSPKYQLIKMAKNWIKSNKKEFAEILCKDKNIQSLMDNSHRLYDKILLVSAMSDLLTSTIIGVSPLTVCVLLFKEGIESLCEDS